MSFPRFMSCQFWLMLLFLIFSGQLGGRPGMLSNLLVNALTFVPVAWWLARRLRGQPYPLANILSATLSFNMVTYILLYAVRIPFPGAADLGKDFALVTGFSLAGALGGLLFPRA